MIPVHIWTHAKLGNLHLFPEYFYDLRRGRHTIYGRPIIHTRHSRLNYQHVGDFAHFLFADMGKPSIHIFVLSPDDLLKGPTNRALGSVCCTLMNVAWTCDFVVTLFLNLTIPKLLKHVSDTTLTCKYIIEHHCKSRPKLAAASIPLNTPRDFCHTHYLAKQANILLFFQDLVILINRICLDGRGIRIQKHKSGFRRNDSDVLVGVE